MLSMRSSMTTLRCVSRGAAASEAAGASVDMVVDHHEVASADAEVTPKPSAAPSRVRCTQPPLYVGT